MASAELSLVNDALVVKLGEDAIANMDDDKLGGLPVRLTYERAVKDALACYPWTFAREWQALGREAQAPGNGWLYVFQLPGQRLGPPIKISDSADLRRAFTGYQLGGTKVFSNADQLYAYFVVRPDPSAWPLAFQNAFVTYLASEFAESVTGDKERRQILRREACGTDPGTMLGGLFLEATRIDAQANPTQSLPLDNNPIVGARFVL